MWYVISGDGAAWTAVEINIGGQLVAMVEEANADTHLSAGDSYAVICEAIANGEVSENVSPETAARVLAAWDTSADPESCCVERILVD